MIMNHIVKSYDSELKRLKNTVTEMGVLVQEQLEKMVMALEKKDRNLAMAVIEGDGKIDRLETQINQDVIRILALRQPVALDLRVVIAALKMANHLERIGDYSANISRRIMALNEPDALVMETPALLLKMTSVIRQMMANILSGFFSQDPTIVKKSWDEDFEVDSLYASLLRELLTYMMEDPRQISACTHLLFIAKSIERVGDHVTNIAEVVYVMIKGHPLEEPRPHPYYSQALLS